jgi:hypothetical protein
MEGNCGMKYQVGDLVLLKGIVLQPRAMVVHHIRYASKLSIRLHPRLLLRLNNTYGVITKVEKHSDIFKKRSTEKDNGYSLFSQIEQKEYYFYEDEVEGEVIK